MLGYGVPRSADLIYPDKADIAHFGLPSKYGKQKSKSKKATRRIWKKKARKLNLDLINEEIKE